MGLDPGLGVLRADQRARDSLALDVMEAIRPEVDADLVDLIDRRTFRRADFFETREGGCRIAAPLTHELAAITILWRTRLAPIVEWVGHLLLDFSIRARTRLASRESARPRTGRPSMSTGNLMYGCVGRSSILARLRRCGLSIDETSKGTPSGAP